MSEFDRLAELADRVRPRDRVAFYQRLDDAAGEAMEEAQERGGWSAASAVFYDWIRIPRLRASVSRPELPPRVANAVATAYYTELEKSCLPN